MTNDGAHGFFGDSVDDFVHGRGELFDEVTHKFRNIHFSLAERWQRNRENIQPIVQILSEFAVTDHLPQVSIARRDDTNIDPRGTGAAHSLELAFLEHSKKLGLKLQRHVSNFVEEQRSTIGQRKTAHVRTNSAGESSALVSEEFAFQKTGGHRRAVHLDEVPATARTELVNRSGDDFLAGSGLAADQDTGISGCDRLNFRED